MDKSEPINMKIPIRTFRTRVRPSDRVIHVVWRGVAGFTKYCDAVCGEYFIPLYNEFR